MRELLLEIGTSVRRNKLRTFLTGFSVAWGIFMLVILLGSGNGLQHGVISNFGSYAVNSIDLYGGWTSKPWMGYNKGRRITLRNSDLEILVREFPEVREVAANSWFNDRNASSGTRFMKIYLRGSLPKIRRIEGVNVVRGRFVDESDIRLYRKVAVIPTQMVPVLFPDRDPLGAPLRIDNSTFTVVGVYEADANRMGASCYIPLTTGQLLYAANDPVVNNAVFTIEGIETDAAMEAFEKRVVRRLSAEHHFDPTDESALWLNNNMERYKTMFTVFRGIALFVWIIGLGTLLAGIVGVSNRIRHPQGARRQTRVDHPADPHRIGAGDGLLRLHRHGAGRGGHGGRGLRHHPPSRRDRRHGLRPHDLPRSHTRPLGGRERHGRAGRRGADRRLHPRPQGRPAQNHRCAAS